MTRGARSAQLALGLLLVAAAALPGRLAAGAPEAPAQAGVANADEPLAQALAPLGPVRALITSALWLQLLHGQMSGDSARAADLARALLSVHPGLSVVREYLAGQLIVTEAPHAPDAARHAALVEAGLALFEEGLWRSDDPALHAAIGRTLAVQSEVDPGFGPAAEAFFGERVEDRAIDELRAGHATGLDAWLLAQLLVDRGERALALDDDAHAAARDLAAAERALDGAGSAVAGERERLLAPLREALSDPASRPRPDTVPDEADEPGEAGEGPRR